MTWTYLLNVVVMLALVAGMAVGTLWLLRKFQPGFSTLGQRDKLVRIVDAVPMGATGGRLAVVEFEGKRILVRRLARTDGRALRGADRGRLPTLYRRRGCVGERRFRRIAFSGEGPEPRIFGCRARNPGFRPSPENARFLSRSSSSWRCSRAILLAHPAFAAAAPGTGRGDAPRRGPVVGAQQGGSARSRATASLLSLSLQIPHPDEPADGVAVAAADDDQLHPDHHRVVAAASGARAPADTAQPGAGRAVAVPHAVHHANGDRPDQHRGGHALWGGQIPLETAIAKSGDALHGFMVRQVRKTDVQLFTDIAHAPKVATPADIPFSILLPAYVTSELKTAFQIGFLIFLPFLVIDLVVGDDLDVARHDDAVADDHLDAVQAAAVRARRRLGADDGQPRAEFRVAMRYAPNPFALSEVEVRVASAAFALRPSTSLRTNGFPAVRVA